MTALPPKAAIRLAGAEWPLWGAAGLDLTPGEKDELAHHARNGCHRLYGLHWQPFASAEPCLAGRADGAGRVWEWLWWGWSGGSDTPTSMQWQTVEEAKAKDRVEYPGQQCCSSSHEVASAVVPRSILKKGLERNDGREG